MTRYTKTDVNTGDVVKSDVNVQLGLVETAITDSLSRKGDSPNTMEADLDMNSNDLLNVARIDADYISVGGVNFSSSDAVELKVIGQEDGVATASQTIITLSTITYDLGNNVLALYINGVKQIFGVAYSETTTSSLTLTSGMEVGDLWEVVVETVSNAVSTVKVNTSSSYVWTGTQDFSLATVPAFTMSGDLTVPNLITAGLVDGRDVSVDGTQLDANTVAVNTTIPSTYLPLAGGALSGSLDVSSDGIVTHSTSTNVILGGSALGSITTAGSNTAIGDNALATASNAGAVNNVAIGANAIQNSTFPLEVVAIGKNAAKNAEIGLTAVGHAAARDLTTAPYCTAVGHSALIANLTGSACTAIGTSSLLLNTGAGNTAIGYQAGSDITTGTENIVIGRASTAGSATAVNRIVLGQSIAGTADNQFSFGLAANVVSNDFGTDALWSRISDVRFKDNIETDDLGLSFISQLRPVTYNWKEGHGQTDVRINGLIAQEVEGALEGKDFNGHVVLEDGTQKLKLEAFIMPLINAVKELSERVEELEAKL